MTKTTLQLEDQQNFEKHKNEFIFVGKDGYPIAGSIGLHVITFIRRLLETRKITRYKTWIKKGGCRIGFD